MILRLLMTLEKIIEIIKLRYELVEFNENNPYKIKDDIFTRFTIVAVILFKNINMPNFYLPNSYIYFLYLYISSNWLSCLIYASIKKENWIKLSETNFFEVKDKLLCSVSFIVIFISFFFQINQAYFYTAILHYIFYNLLSALSIYIKSKL